MEIKVKFLDNLRLEAKFDDFTMVADQPIRYKGDGSAPGPFDYFLASSALCAAYFVKLYCDTRNIPTENIRLSQNNIVDPENRYNQIFKIQVELPADISDKDRQGILRSIDRCTVKKVVQAGPEFVIEEVENLDADAQALLMPASISGSGAGTYIVGKDLPLEQTIANMSGILADLGMKIEIASWRNIVPNVCSLPYVRQSDGEVVYFPSNLIENLYLSNGMSAGNTLAEAQVQCLSEIFERAVKREIIEGEFALPDVPADVLAKYPAILAGIQGLEAQGFPVPVKDASLGGEFPVMCVTLMNPRTGGVFASFGAHPSLEVALERSLTELLQGRSFEGLNDLPQPTFASQALMEPNNFVEHFIDSSGVVSWRFFSAKADYEFVEWDFSSEGEQANAEEAATLFG